MVRMAEKDFYAILEVNRNASESEIKAAFRKLARKYHPDKNPGDKQAEQKFKELGAAYEVLSDPQKKAAYDRLGHQAFTEGAAGGAGGEGFYGFGGEGFSSIFDDFLAEFMGGGGGSGRSRRARPEGAHVAGKDVQFRVAITLEEAFSGVQTDVEFPTLLACTQCQGSGGKAGSKPMTCTTCRGHGVVHMQRGFLTVEQACPACHGQGQTIKDPCNDCKGQGRVRGRRTVTVKIPAGIDEGSRVRLSGKGEDGARGGPAGDLYVHVQLKAHDLFQREGTSLHCRYPVSMIAATLGSEIQVPTLDGETVALTVPAGTQPGDRLTLRGKGMPSLRGGARGHLYVQADVYTPVNLSKRQREILQEFSQEERNATDTAQGFFTTLKNFVTKWGRNNPSSAG